MALGAAVCPVFLAAHTPAQVIGVAGLPLPFYKSDTLLLSFGLSLRIHDLVCCSLLTCA